MSICLYASNVCADVQYNEETNTTINRTPNGTFTPGEIIGKNTIGEGIGVLGDRKYIHTTYVSSDYYLQDNTRGAKILTYNVAKKSSNILPWKNTTNIFNTQTDAALIDAHFYTGVAYDYFKKLHGRNSYDNQGASIKSVVHVKNDGDTTPIAAWDTKRSTMIYGDGDGIETRSPAGALDVIGHELTHAMIDHSSKLQHRGESGALNEAMADLFGTLIEHDYYKNNATRKPNWKIGEDIYVDGQTIIRSMSAPASVALPSPLPDRYGTVHTHYPDHYSKLYKGTPDEHGGMLEEYVNSSIINKASYLLANGGTHYGVKVNGIGCQKVGAIYYLANTEIFDVSTNFKQARQGLEKAAAKLYGKQSEEVQAVKAAYDAVGIYL